MTTDARLDKARSILALLTSETRFATNMERMFARCADKADVLGAFSYTPELWGFQVTRDALHMTLISTLGRIHDTANGDNACFETLRECLLDQGVRGLVLQGADDVDDLAMRMDAALAAMAAPELKERVSVVRELRNKRIAHRDRKVRAYRAKYGDERRLLEMTTPIVHELGRIVFGIYSDLLTHDASVRRLADTFWRALAKRQANRRRPKMQVAPRAR